MTSKEKVEENIQILESYVAVYPEIESMLIEAEEAKFTV